MTWASGRGPPYLAPGLGLVFGIVAVLTSAHKDAPLWWAALKVSDDLKAATLHVADATVVDTRQRFGDANVPAAISLDVTWTAAGPPHHYTPGSTDPIDPTNFDGKFRIAQAAGTLSGSNAEGFSFRTVGTISSAGVSSVFGIPGWAEMGIERNGSFLKWEREDAGRLLRHSALARRSVRGDFG